MARRMTESGKWDDDWFMNLSAPTKLLYFYLLDSCDHAGIWKVNRRLAEFKIGCGVAWDESLAELGNRIQVLGAGDRWFIRKFVHYQYGSVYNEKNNAHQSVLRVLRSHGLDWVAPTHPPMTPLGGALDVDKDNSSSRGESAERGLAKVREKQFKDLLVRLTVADGASAIRKWWALSAGNDLAKTFEDRCDLVYWCVKKARASGMKVEYASHVLDFVSQWRPVPQEKTA
jgi:hypothetical protein